MLLKMFYQFQLLLFIQQSAATISIFKFLSSFQLFLQHSRHRQATLFELVGLLSKKNFPPDGQTRWAKSTSQQVNLLSARPSMIPSHPGKIIPVALRL